MTSCFYILSLALAKSTPLLLASFGGMVSELSGVINFALEGMMLVGAFGAVWGAAATGSPWLGLLAGAAGGMLVGLVHAVVSLKFRANQIISAVALNLLAAGITGTLLNQVFDAYGTSPTVPKLPGIDRAVSGLLSVFGAGGADLMQGVSVLVPIGLAACLGILICVGWGRIGLRIRACGENPNAAEACGLALFRTRLLALMVSGVLAGAGGAYLSIGELSQFVERMTQGRGYLAVAAVILGRWRPVGVMAAAVFFGFSEAVSEWLAVRWTSIPPQVFPALPYLICLTVLMFRIGKRQPPSSLGQV